MKRKSIICDVCGKEIDKGDARIKANNTIEMTVKLKMYENGEMFYAKQIFDLGDIKDAEDLFEQCCDGEYPRYTLTEKGKEYVKKLRGERMVGDGEDD